MYVCMYVCVQVCKRGPNLRYEVKRYKGACVMSLWKSIKSAVCTAHHITHAYKCTHIRNWGEIMYEGAACEKYVQLHCYCTIWYYSANYILFKTPIGA